MRTRATIVTAVALTALAGLPATAGGATPRQDSYYEIWCYSAPTDTWYLAKRVDARAIQPEREPGGKDTATERFNENNPYGETCHEEGPITP